MQDAEQAGDAQAAPAPRAEVLRALFDTISDAPICVLDRDLRIVEALGGSYAESLGLSPVGSPAGPGALLTAVDRETLHALAREIFASGEPRRFELALDFPVGRVSIDLRFQPLLSPRGEVEHVLVTALDLTERRRAEEALSASEQHFESLAEAAPLGVWRTGRDRRIAWANRRLWQILDVEPETVAGLELPALLARFTAEGWLDAPQAERLWSEAERAYQEERGNAVEMHHRRRDGSLRWLQVRVEPELDAAGRFVGHVGAVNDISDLKQVQEELARHRDHLNDLVAERTAALERTHEALRRSERLAAVGTFAAGIAHQINNPLAAILLAAQRALEAPDDAQGALEALRGIADDARHCGRIVRGVLEFAHGPKAEPQPCDLNAIVRLCAPQIARDARERGAELRFDLEEGLAPVAGSESALEQVIVNLVWNAIQASAREIVVRSRAGEGEVELAVVDDGVGIPAEDRLRVFDPLFTTRPSRGGTGLGLALAQGIVRAYGGRIELDSQPARGTAISVRLPRA